MFEIVGWAGGAGIAVLYVHSHVNQRQPAPRHCTKIVGMTLTPTMRATAFYQLNERM
jgi:xanthosine utilization system XapX-like protein